MTGPTAASTGQHVLVRYWAGARAAAGVAEETFPAPVTLSDLLHEVVVRHPDRGRGQAVPGADFIEERF